MTSARFGRFQIVITGFNTDVNYDGVTYHVQTEDKGVETPLILSLVYQHGTILASKRSKYDDLIESGFNEEVLAERLKRQHSLMCAAVKTGRINDLKRMTIARARKVKQGIDEAIQETKLPTVPENKNVPAVPPSKVEPTDAEEPTTISLTEDDVRIISDDFKEKKNADAVWDIPIIEDVTIIESDKFFEEGFMLSPDAISIVEDEEPFEEEWQEELKIKLLADYTFKSGEKKNINVLVCRGNSDSEVENANVMVKVLGSDFRPIIFHARSDKHGVATIFVKLPIFRTGRAALLVRAAVGGEETELRRVIFHK